MFHITEQVPLCEEGVGGRHINGISNKQIHLVCPVVELIKRMSLLSGWSSQVGVKITDVRCLVSGRRIGQMYLKAPDVIPDVIFYHSMWMILIFTY